MAGLTFDDLVPSGTTPAPSGGGALTFDDVTKDIQPQRTLLGERVQQGGGGPGGMNIRGALAILEQPAAGIWGLGSMVGAAATATANLYREKLRQWTDGTMPEIKGRAVHQGKSAGEIWRDEYNLAAENAHKMYVPITPEGAKVTEKMSEWIGHAVQWVGDQMFEKGLVVPSPQEMIPRALGIKTPLQEATQGAPVTGAIGQAVATLGTLLTPTGKKAPKAEPPPPTSMEVWQAFEKKYPETVKRMDTLGTVRMGDFAPGDTTMFDVLHRRLNQELGLTGDATKVPLETKVQAAILKTDPTLPMGEVTRATRSFMDQVSQLDAARDARANALGLPAPRPAPAISKEPVVVTPGGVALTPEQAAAADAAFLGMTSGERADALGVSAMGRLRLRLEEAQQATGPAAIAARNRLKQEWAQTFPYRDPAKRSAALEAFENFGGRMTWEEASAKMGDPLPNAPKGRGLTKAGPGAHQQGMIDIEGLHYTLQSFADLPNKEVLKRSTILGALNQAKVPQAEKDVVLRAIGDRDSITQAELKGDVAASILPLQAKDTLDYATYGLDNIGVRPARLQGEPNPLGGTQFPYRTTIWRMPMESDLGTKHFADPQYFAHTRSFDKGGVRSIVELQSDLVQNLKGREQQLNQLAIQPNEVPQARRLLQEVLEGDPTDFGFSKASEVYLNTIAERRAAQLGISVDAARRALEDDVHFLAIQLEDGISAAISAGRDAELTHVRAMSDRWFERILLEENRRASQQGIRTMRMGDADTIAKVEGWPTDTIINYEGKEYGLYAGPGNVAWIDLSTGAPIKSGPVYDALTTLFNEGKYTDRLPKKYQGIYRRYRDDIPKILKQQFNARAVKDEKGNGWWEWDVRADSATKKIPAFGGKQRGAIILEGFEDVQKKMADAGAKARAAAVRSWPLGSVENERQTHSRVSAVFEESLRAQEESVKVTLGDRLARLKRGVFGHDIDLKDALDKAGPYGEAAKARMVLQRGATDAARIEMEAVNDRIFKDLSPEDKRLVDEIARARRIIEIDGYKGIGTVKHEGGVTGPEAEAFVRETRRQIGDERFTALNGKVDAIFMAYKDLLVDRLRDGLLSADDFNRLIHFDYNPTQYIDLLDPIMTYDIRGQKISVRSSGVQDLGHGKRAPTMMDTQTMLAEAIGRTRNLQFKNKTLQALFELGKERPENGIVQVIKDGKPNQPKPHGWSRLGVRIEGEQRELFMPDELAEQFVSNPQPMLPWVANAIRLLSGSASLRATAVGANPIFPVAGIPMDIFHTWMVAGKEYSPHLPVYAAQIGKDMVAVLPDLIRKGGTYEQAMKEGLGAHYAADYGQHVFTRDRTMAERMMPRYQKIMNVLRGFNQEADVWIRLAHRNRLISEGLPSEKATAIARDRLDYAQGGELIRALDTAIPWTNVGVQALYKVGKSASKNPGDFAIKATWLTGAIASSVLANMIASPETWQSIPTRDKISGLQITFGDQFYIVDPDGNKRYFYIPVRMDQTAAPLAGTVVGALEAAEYGKAPSDLIGQTVSQSVNLFGGIDLVPTMSAGMALAGIDPYTLRQLPSTGHARPSTSVIAKEITEVTGGSPIRLEAAFGKLVSTNNLWLRLAGSGIKELLGDSDPRAKEKVAEHMLAEHLRPIVKLTNPLTKFLDGVDKVVSDVTNEQVKQMDAVDELVYKVGRGQATRDDLRTYIRNQPPEDRPRLVARAEHGYAIDQIMRRYDAGSAPGVPPAAWWRVLSGAPARARAQEFHNKWLDASPEDRKKMESIAGALGQKGAGFMSEDFKHELAKERALLGTDRR